MEWLVDRVRWHLDPEKSTARVFVSEAPDGNTSDKNTKLIELFRRHGYELSQSKSELEMVILEKRV